MKKKSSSSGIERINLFPSLISFSAMIATLFGPPAPKEKSTPTHGRAPRTIGRVNSKAKGRG